VLFEPSQTARLTVEVGSLHLHLPRQSAYPPVRSQTNVRTSLRSRVGHGASPPFPAVGAAMEQTCARFPLLFRCGFISVLSPTIVLLLRNPVLRQRVHQNHFGEAYKRVNLGTIGMKQIHSLKQGFMGKLEK